MHRSLLPFLLCVPLTASLVAGQEAERSEGEVDAAFRAGYAAIQEGDFRRAIAAFHRVTQLDRGNGRGWLMLGYSLHGAQKLDEALPVHEKAVGFPEVAHIAAYNVACVHSLRGDSDRAFAWLDKAIELGFCDPAQVANDSDLDPLRDDQRFAELEKRLRDALRVLAVTTDRRSARVAWFDKDGSPGQVALGHAVLPWQARFDRYLDAPELVGRHWRLGSDFWTTLDNSVPLVVSGVEIPAGYWYLTLLHRGDHRFVLAVHDPALVRKMRLDPSRADLLRGGIRVPMHYRVTEASYDELSVRLVLPAGARQKGTLRIGFGRHELRGDATVALARRGR